MHLLRKVLTTLGGICLVALLIAALAPKAARGLAAVLVQVGNTPTNPVPVTEVGALQPFHAKCGSDTPGHAIISCSVTVPAGKRLVLQQVSTAAIIDPSNSVTNASVVYVSQGSEDQFVFDLVQTRSSGFAEFVRTQPVTAYADPGSTVTCQIFELNPSANFDQIGCFLVGYLVDQ